jgi:hypothetical protein
LQAAFIFQSLAVSTTDGGYMHDDDAMQQAWEQELEEFLEWQETFGARNEDKRINREDRSSAVGSAKGNHLRCEGCNESAF